MKKFAVTICALFLASAALAGEQSYRALLNDQGEYCAKVDVGIIGAPYYKTKCRTIEEWKAEGFTVDIPN